MKVAEETTATTATQMYTRVRLNFAMALTINALGTSAMGRLIHIAGTQLSGWLVFPVAASRWATIMG